MKKQDNNMLIRMAVFTAVLLMASFGIIYWWQEGISAPNVKDDATIDFVIFGGEGIKGITNKLYQAKLISSQTAFFILLKLNNLDRQIQAGEYRLKRSMDAVTLAKELTHGVMDRWVTLIEGWRKEEAAIVISREFSIPESEFTALAKEGYIFPDTYAIPKEATVGAILDLISDNFIRKTDHLFNSYSGQLSKSEIIILASIIEREGKTEVDKPMIAGILLNRLNKKWPLQVDATLQYALGYQTQEKTWWKKGLTDADKKILSKYNTYENVGLPPAPISNPGLSSISAVINPMLTDYMYYIHDSKGIVHYAITLQEHEKNIDLYLR